MKKATLIPLITILTTSTLTLGMVNAHEQSSSLSVDKSKKTYKVATADTSLPDPVLPPQNR